MIQKTKKSESKRNYLHPTQAVCLIDMQAWQLVREDFIFSKNLQSYYTELKFKPLQIHLLNILLQNHSYSQEPWFLYCKKFAGLWGFTYVGNWFVALQCKTIQCGDINSRVKLTHEIQEQRSPMYSMTFDFSHGQVKSYSTNVDKCKVISIDSS